MAALQRIIVVLIWLLGTCFSNVGGDDDEALVYKTCNGVQFGWGAMYRSELDAVLQDLVLATPNHSYDYYSQSTDSGQGCYGHAACNGVISPADCFNCLMSAKIEIETGCPYNTGAQLQLKDCRIRCENYQFIE